MPGHLPPFPVEETLTADSDSNLDPKDDADEEDTSRATGSSLHENPATPDMGGERSAAQDGETALGSIVPELDHRSLAQPTAPRKRPSQHDQERQSVKILINTKDRSLTKEKRKKKREDAQNAHKAAEEAEKNLPSLKIEIRRDSIAPQADTSVMMHTSRPSESDPIAPKAVKLRVSLAMPFSAPPPELDALAAPTEPEIAVVGHASVLPHRNSGEAPPASAATAASHHTNTDMALDEDEDDAVVVKPSNKRKRLRLKSDDESDTEAPAISAPVVHAIDEDDAMQHVHVHDEAHRKRKKEKKEKKKKKKKKKEARRSLEAGAVSVLSAPSPTSTEAEPAKPAGLQKRLSVVLNMGAFNLAPITAEPEADTATASHLDDDAPVGHVAVAEPTMIPEAAPVKVKKHKSKKHKRDKKVESSPPVSTQQAPPAAVEPCKPAPTKPEVNCNPGDLPKGLRLPDGLRGTLNEPRPYWGKPIPPHFDRPLEQPVDPGEEEQFYCICGRDELFGTMVECDECESWYHYVCLGQLALSLGDEDSWLCTDCMQDKKVGDVVDHPLTPQVQKQLLAMLTHVRGLKDAHFFETAPLDIEGYTKIVYEPMDLATVEQRLTDGGFYPRENKYPCVRAFDRDMQLIFDNCKFYNSQTPDGGKTWIKLADRLLKAYNKKIDKLLKDQRSALLKSQL